MVENGQGYEQEHQKGAPTDQSEVLFPKGADFVDIGQVKDIKQEEHQEDTGMQASNSEDGNCPRVMMIIELEDESMGNLVLFVHVHIKPKYPDIKDEDGDSPPSGEIPCKCAVLL